MKNSHIDNIGVLKKFVSDNSLQNSNSIIRFNCEFKITTPKATQIEECEARITFDGYNNEGELTVHSNLPPEKYPTVFKAKYNEFSIEDNNLFIRDEHPTIGKYEAEIIPFDKV
jgi:hypothetical protein